MTVLGLIGFMDTMSAQERIISRAATRDVFILPSMEWNYHDGFMLGALFTNYAKVVKGWKYHLRPQYAFGSNDLAGTANVGYDILRPTKAWHRSWLALDAKYYSLDGRRIDGDKSQDRYLRLDAEAAVFHRKKLENHSLEQRLSTRFVFSPVWFDNFDSNGVLFRDSYSTWLQEFRYERRRRDKLTPSEYIGFIHLNADFIKLSAHGQWAYAYGNLKTKIRLRAHAEYLPYESSTTDSNFRTNYTLQPNGRPGFGVFQNDYTYDATLLGRSRRDGIWSQQSYAKGADLKTRATLIASGPYLLGAGLSVELPIDMPPYLRPYIDVALMETGLSSNAELLYSSGIELGLIPGFLSIYFPVLESKLIRDNYSLNLKNSYWNKISWRINIIRQNHIAGRFYN